LYAHKGNADQVKRVCWDMWPAYIAGVEVSFPQVNITFDYFHIMEIIKHAVDEVRRQEAKTIKALKKTRYLWLKNLENLSAEQRQKMAS
jgi:transposase